MLSAAQSAPPMLLPIDQLEGGSAAPSGARAEPSAAPIEPRARARRTEAASPSLPFTGFSLLALVVSGIGATTAGRRLHLAIADPAPADGATTGPAPAPVAPLAMAPAPRPAPRSRRPVYVGLALMAVTALAVARTANTARA